MSSDRDPQHERLNDSLRRENAMLRRQVEWLSRQLFGRVMPGLLTLPGPGEDDDTADMPLADGCLRSDVDTKLMDGGLRSDADAGPGNIPGSLREPSAPYRVSAPSSAPSSAPAGLPSEDVTLELPSNECRGMTVAGFERSEAVGTRPAVVRRNILRAMYVPNDGSGSAAAAPAPALFPDPSGGPLVFDASFAAYVAELRLSGVTFQAISERLDRENGLAISREALRRLASDAAETAAPVCIALFERTLPGWRNLLRRFEQAKAGGDWFAGEFMQKIHALSMLEEQAVLRAERFGGAPEDLYRERRAVRSGSVRIAGAFFDRCREMLPVLDAGSPLAETIRYALEHESFLCGFLHDPRLEMSRADPETPVADPFVLLAVCEDECRTRGVPFRTWLEHVLNARKQPVPPPVESLFPH